MPNNIQIADKPTLDEVRNTTGEINDKIGNPADLENAGSVMGKLNKVLSDASTNMGYIMAAENCTTNITTSSYTVSASSTKIQKVASITTPHAGKGRVVVALDGFTANGNGTLTVYVSTTSSDNPSLSTLESTKKGVSKDYNINAQATAGNYRSAVVCVETADLSSNTTYYIHVVVVNGTAERTIQTKEVCASVTYTTTTPCQTIIKSIQTGESNTGVVTINPVVPEKCVLLINSQYESGVAGWVTATKLILVKNIDFNQQLNTLKCFWQIIEFY